MKDYVERARSVRKGHRDRDLCMVRGRIDIVATERNAEKVYSP